MENNIELRSEKVRNIIGKMPPALIRYGISSFFIIITLLIIGSSYFEYTPSRIIDAKIDVSSSDTSIILYIPPSLKSDIKIGTQATIDFYSIKEINNDYKLQVIINQIENELTITKNGTFYIATATLTEDSQRYMSNFKSDGYVQVKMNLFFKKTSVFENVVNMLFN